jgi:hypothetical protein
VQVPWALHAVWLVPNWLQRRLHVLLVLSHRHTSLFASQSALLPCLLHGSMQVPFAEFTSQFGSAWHFCRSVPYFAAQVFTHVVEFHSHELDASHAAMFVALQFALQDEVSAFHWHRVVLLQSFELL